MRKKAAFNSEIIWFDDEFEADQPEFECNNNWIGLYPKPEEYFAE